LTRKNKKGIKYFYKCVPVSTGGVRCNREINENLLENILLENIGKLFDTSLPEPLAIDLDKEVGKIDSKIERILDLDIENLPKDKIEKKIEQLQQEKVELLNQQKIVSQNKNINQYFKTIEDIYPYTNREERKRLWNILIQRITIYDS
jgi:hypothetical protein